MTPIASDRVSASRWTDTVRALFPGVVACAVVAAAASFLSEHYGAPVMLFALLLGSAMNHLGRGGPCEAGVAFTARTLLRLGVALLGLRITMGQVVDLGWQPVAVVIAAVTSTIAVSMGLARLLGFRATFGLLSGGATAICGASAALALSAALPAHPQKERATLFTVVLVSMLSTVAMITYPMIAAALGFDSRAAGIFLGATIHDVAQVVGAGYGMSPETGDVATVVKLMRVAMLVPVILFAVVLTRSMAAGDGDDAAGAKPPLLPAFAVGFLVLVGVSSTGWVPAAWTSAGSDVARLCLVMAIAALGMRTHLRDLAQVGWKPVLLMVGETVFLAGLVLVLLAVFR